MRTSETPSVVVRIDHRLLETMEVIEASGHDIRLRCKGLVDCGTPVEILTETGFPAETRTYPGVVHWCHCDRRQWTLGVALVQLAPLELLVRTTGSMRDGLRYDCSVSVQIRLPNGREFGGKVLNYGRDGACLTANEPIPIGESLTVTWSRIGETGSGQMTVLPKWATFSGFAIAGCNLTSGPLYPMSAFRVDRWLNQNVSRVTSGTSYLFRSRVGSTASL